MSEELAIAPLDPEITTSPSPGKAAPSPAKRLIKAAIKLAVFAAMVWFWVVFIRKSGMTSLGELHWQVDWPAVLGASLAYLAASILFGVLWSPLCREICGVHLGPALAFRASMIAWFARYIPGKVWSVAAKMFYSCPEKSQIAPVTIAITVETLWFEVSGLLLAAIVLPWYPQIAALAGQYRTLRLVSVLFIAASFLLAWPPVFCFICNLGLRIFRQPPLPRRPRYRVLLALTLGYMAVFALLSTGFIILARSFAPIHAADFPLLAGAFTASWVIGVLAFLAPNGLGVRETLLLAALSPSGAFTQATLPTLVLASRIVGTVVEVFCAAVAALLPIAGMALTAREKARKSER